MIAPPLTKYGIARTTVRIAWAPGMNRNTPHSNCMAMKASAKPSHCSFVMGTRSSSPPTSYVSVLDGSHGLDIDPRQVEEHLLVALEHPRQRELRRSSQSGSRQFGTS